MKYIIILITSLFLVSNASAEEKEFIWKCVRNASELYTIEEYFKFDLKEKGKYVIYERINAKWFVKVEEPSIENPNGYIFEYGKENQSLVVRTHTVIVESFQLSTVQTYDFLTKHIESVTILNDEKKEITKYKCEEVS